MLLFCAGFLGPAADVLRRDAVFGKSVRRLGRCWAATFTALAGLALPASAYECDAAYDLDSAVYDALGDLQSDLDTVEQRKRFEIIKEEYQVARRSCMCGTCRVCFRERCALGGYSEAETEDALRDAVARIVRQRRTGGM